MSEKPKQYRSRKVIEADTWDGTEEHREKLLKYPYFLEFKINKGWYFFNLGCKRCGHAPYSMSPTEFNRDYEPVEEPLIKHQFVPVGCNMTPGGITWVDSDFEPIIPQAAKTEE